MEADEEFDAIATSLERVGARRGRMMGRPMLSVQGRMFACLEGRRSLALRLGRTSAEHADALAVPGAVLFAPGGGERVFADWVALPPETLAEWEPRALQALRFASALPAAPRRRPRGV